MVHLLEPIEADWKVPRTDHLSAAMRDESTGLRKDLQMADSSGPTLVKRMDVLRVEQWVDQKAAMKGKPMVGHQDALRVGRWGVLLVELKAIHLGCCLAARWAEYSVRQWDS